MLSFLFSTVFGIIAAIFGLITYIFSAIGFYTMSKRYGLTHAWIAWIPFLQYYLLGELIGNKIFGLNNAKWILVLAPIVLNIISSLVSSAFLIGVLELIGYLLVAAAYYKLFKIYKPESAILYLISGIIIAPLLGLWVFLIRNNRRHAVTL